MKTYQELREAGTPGEWLVHSPQGEVFVATGERGVCGFTGGCRDGQLIDAQLIAHEHNHFPKLLAALDDLIMALPMSLCGGDAYDKARAARAAATTITEGK